MDSLHKFTFEVRVIAHGRERYSRGTSFVGPKKNYTEGFSL